MKRLSPAHAEHDLAQLAERFEHWRRSKPL